MSNEARRTALRMGKQLEAAVFNGVAGRADVLLYRIHDPLVKTKTGAFFKEPVPADFFGLERDETAVNPILVECKWRSKPFPRDSELSLLTKHQRKAAFDWVQLGGEFFLITQIGNEIPQVLSLFSIEPSPRLDCNPSVYRYAAKPNGRNAWEWL